jgi:dTDP-4-dehydrorhamnose 3,5-epimerase
MHLEKTHFEGLYIVLPRIYTDYRGYFFESWNREVFERLGISEDFSQDNQSCSAKDVIRGLHFQVPPFEQGKLVRVTAGSVLDVVVDLRKNQPTFGKNFKLILTASQNNMLYIPPGFAHGFRSLQDNTIFVYKCTKVYDQKCERAIRWNDPILNIDWEITDPVLSEKDQQAPGFAEFDSPFL